MNNRSNMMTLLTLGAAGAAIYGITKGVQNGTFQKLPQTISNALSGSQMQQMTNSQQSTQNNQQATSTSQQDGTEQQMGTYNQYS